MLTTIKKENINELISKYPDLSNYDMEFLLYETESNYILPRHFYKNYKSEYLNIFEDDDFKPKELPDIIFTGELRDEQKDLIKNIKDIYNSKGSINGIIKAKPGFGKTVCAACITSELKRKTLIVLDNSKLVEQWTDAYVKFTNLTTDNIGFIIGKKFDPKEITITMVQTLISKIKTDPANFYTKMKNEGFDLVFFDEMHKTSSTTIFGKASIFLNSKNIIGLTATPYGDKLHKFFMTNIIGDILFEYAEYNNAPDVYFIKYNSGLAAKHYFKLNQIKDYIKKIGFYNKILPESETYYKLILDLVRKLKISKSKRYTIIIVFTVNQLKKTIDYLEQHGIKAKALYSKEQDIDKENDDILVATYKLASHGFDFDALSCLILATPLKGKTSLIQTIGRILRKKEGKAKPLVFDLIDMDFGPFFAESIPRKMQILQNEFKVETFKHINF